MAGKTKWLAKPISNPNETCRAMKSIGAHSVGAMIVRLLIKNGPKNGKQYRKRCEETHIDGIPRGGGPKRNAECRRSVCLSLKVLVTCTTWLQWLTTRLKRLAVGCWLNFVPGCWLTIRVVELSLQTGDLLV